MTLFPLASLILTAILAVTVPNDNERKANPIQMLPVKVDFKKQSATFQFKNVGDKSLWFNGHGDKSPMYSVRFKVEGEWKSQRLGWCGTGMAIREFEPGTSLEVVYNFKHLLGLKDQNVSEGQIGIAFSQQAKGKGFETSWSQSAFLIQECHEPIKPTDQIEDAPMDEFPLEKWCDG